MNEEIRSDKVQLITFDGVNHGVVSRREALNAAEDAGLDLVMIAEKGSEGFPITKVMDYGKELYNKKKKQTESRKNQVIVQIKEIKLRPKIGIHDYVTKMNQGLRFLHEGKKLKVTLMFRGREMVNKHERGTELFDKVRSTFEEHNLLERIIEEKEAKAGSAWSKVYSLKPLA